MFRVLLLRAELLDHLNDIALCREGMRLDPDDPDLPLMLQLLTGEYARILRDIGDYEYGKWSLLHNMTGVFSADGANRAAHPEPLPWGVSPSSQLLLFLLLGRRAVVCWRVLDG